MLMFALCDDGGIVVFDSADHPPNSMEWIDVENGEYHFCDEHGQLYMGQIVRPATFFRPEQWCLVPVGPPSTDNVSSLIEEAIYLNPNKFGFADLRSFKQYLFRHER